MVPMNVLPSLVWTAIGHGNMSAIKRLDIGEEGFHCRRVRYEPIIRKKSINNIGGQSV